MSDQLTQPMTEAFVRYLRKPRKFRHRDDLNRMHAEKPSRTPKSGLPVTKLPVDCLGSPPPSLPMDGNDSLGDCGEAMICHDLNIASYRKGLGTEVSFSLSALEAQYTRHSGGDNGLSEEDVIAIGKEGVGGNTAMKIADYLDINVNDTALAQACIDYFNTINMAWSVPDDFLQNFTPGSSWLSASVPNPNNGHFTPLTNVDKDGNYNIITWGAMTGPVSPLFIASVQPQCFVTFSTVQFDPKTGLDSKGRHITDVAAFWVEIGGTPIPATYINQFPPKDNPVPVTPPTPPSPPVPIPPVPAPPSDAVVIPVAQMLYAKDSGTIAITAPALFAAALAHASVEFPWAILIQMALSVAPQIVRLITGKSSAKPGSKLAIVVDHLKAGDTLDSAGLADLIKLIEANLPEIFADIVGSIPASDPHRRATSTSVVVTPVNVGDRLANYALYQAELAQLESVGITDGPIVAAFQGVTNSILVAGATDVQAFAGTAKDPALPSITDGTTNFSVNTTATPPILVPLPVVLASTIPVVAPVVTPPAPPAS
jgi:hypothetical protein